jgi:hypothetical protein
VYLLRFRFNSFVFSIFCISLFFVPNSSGATKATIWNSSAVPASLAAADSKAAELGVRFRSDVAGVITGVRFYKGTTNTGTHTGSLWSNSGNLLATATFTNETASGWQEVTFSQPVAITANTVYVASYHTNVGHYSLNLNYFANAIDNAPLHALADGTTGGNGLYAYGSGGVFPSSSWAQSNYWVDVAFVPNSSSTTNYTVSGTVSAGSGATVTLSGGTTATKIADASGNFSFTVPNGTYTVTASKSGYTMTPTSRSVTVNGANVSGVTFTASANSGSTKVSIWPPSAVPAIAANSDSGAVELGVRFRSDVSGQVTGIRFYKGSTNTGTHTGSLWSNTGTRLATATFTNETSSGWQEVSFAQPVTITANTVYVASYHTNTGQYALNQNFFSVSVDKAPLHAPADTSTSHNGVYVYGPGGIFPTDSYLSSNYWVDVAFVSGSGSGPITNYTVSGNVSGGSGATVTLSGGANSSTTADASGNFSFTVPNGTYTVTASKSGYAMTPTSRSVTVSGANVTGVTFTATASTATYTISGTISGGAGATVSLSGAKTASTTASSTGTYSFTGLANGTYTVKPTLSGYAMTPTSKSVTVNGANVASTNFTAAVGAAHSVDLSWTASTSSGVSGYKVYRSTTSGSGYALQTSAPVTSTIYKDVNVAAGTTYYYVVRSVNSSGTESANSNQATAAVPTP